MGNDRWTESEKEEVKRLWAAGRSAGEIAATLGPVRTANGVATLLSRMRRAGDVPPTQQAMPATPPATETVDTDLDSNYGKLRIDTATRITTPEEALAKAGLSEDEWTVERLRIKSYESCHKDEKGNAVVTPMWSVQCNLAKKKGFSYAEMIEGVKGAISEVAGPSPQQPWAKANDSGTLAVVSIIDHHFGKLCWAPETGENYDVEIAKQRYNEAADLLLLRCWGMEVEEIVVLVGHDFYHVDTGRNTTTSGTIVETDGRWQKAYLAGLACVRRLVEEARKIAPVRIVVVPGNHDEERAFTLGVALNAYYDGCEGVTVDNRPSTKKEYVWGNTFLGFAHAHHCRNAAQERAVLDSLKTRNAEAWGQATWRELLTGHLHHEREDVWQYRATQDVQQCIVRRCPSLSGTDKWHDDHNFKSLQAAEVYFYDKKNGRFQINTATLSEVEAV